MARVNSKKFFYESITGKNPSNISLLRNIPSAIPNKNLLKNPKLVDIVIDVLAYSIPTPKSTLDTPDKLGEYYDSQAERLIEKKHRITFRYLNLQHEVYSEIVSLVSKRKILNFDEIQMVKFLENEAIEIGLSQLLKDYSGEATTLTILRKKSPKGLLNTCCYNCGKVLERHRVVKQNPHYCTKKENPICFYERLKADKQEAEEWRIILNKPHCAHCGNELVFYADPELNNLHKGLYFCPPNKYRKNLKNCWEAYRKNKQRKLYA